MPKTDTPLLDEGELTAIDLAFKRGDANLHLYIPALCQTVRGLRAENDRLQASETYWQAEALLNHFCSSHASNKRQMGHYCTVCAKPFAMSVPQGTRPLTYNQIRDRLAQVEQERDDAQKNVAELSRVIFDNEHAQRMRSACVERVKGLADEWLRRAINEQDVEVSCNLRLSYNVAQNIAETLGSVSILDGEGQTCTTKKS